MMAARQPPPPPPPAPTDRVLPRKLFAQAFEEERLRLGYSHAHVAKGTSVPEARSRDWASGEAVPTRAEFARLCAHFRRLRFFPPDWDRTPAPVTLPARGRPRFEAAEPLPVSLPEGRGVESLPFAEALRLEREAEGLTQDDLGSILGVAGTAVCQWEGGEIHPVRDHYEGLCDLFPRLRRCAKPPVRDIPKPVGRTLAARSLAAEVRDAPIAEASLGGPAILPEMIRDGSKREVLNVPGVVAVDATNLPSDFVTDEVRDGLVRDATASGLASVFGGLPRRVQKVLPEPLRAKLAEVGVDVGQETGVRPIRKAPDSKECPTCHAQVPIAEWPGHRERHKDPGGSGDAGGGNAVGPGASMEAEGVLAPPSPPVSSRPAAPVLLERAIVLGELLHERAVGFHLEPAEGGGWTASLRSASSEGATPGKDLTRAAALTIEAAVRALGEALRAEVEERRRRLADLTRLLED